MYRRILIMLLLVVVWNAGWVFAEKKARFRLTTPIAAEYGDIEGATNITEQGSGYGLEYFFERLWLSCTKSNPNPRVAKCEERKVSMKKPRSSACMVGWKISTPGTAVSMIFILQNRL